MSAWTWMLHDASGNDLRASGEFESQAAAETWMADHWASLIEEGAETVSLDGDGKRHYTMGLRAE